MNAKIEIIEAMQQYMRKNNRRPSAVVLSRTKALDIAKLDREEIGQLAEDFVRWGEDQLEAIGFLGMRVKLVSDGPDITFE